MQNCCKYFLPLANVCRLTHQPNTICPSHAVQIAAAQQELLSRLTPSQLSFLQQRGKQKQTASQPQHTRPTKATTKPLPSQKADTQPSEPAQASLPAPGWRRASQGDVSVAAQSAPSKGHAPADKGTGVDAAPARNSIASSAARVQFDLEGTPLSLSMERDASAAGDWQLSQQAVQRDPLRYEHACGALLLSYTCASCFECGCHYLSTRQ